VRWCGRAACRTVRPGSAWRSGRRPWRLRRRARRESNSCDWNRLDAGQMGGSDHECAPCHASARPRAPRRPLPSAGRKACRVCAGRAKRRPSRPRGLLFERASVRWRLSVEFRQHDSTPESILSVQRRCDTRMPARSCRAGRRTRRAGRHSRRCAVRALATTKGSDSNLASRRASIGAPVGGDDRDGAVLLPQAVGRRSTTSITRRRGRACARSRS